MSARHLRIYYIDPYGHEVDRGSLSSAVMPKYKVPVHKLPAERYAGPSHVHRRELAATIMLSERRRGGGHPNPIGFEFVGVIIVACPARDKAAYRSKRRRTAGIRVRLVPTNTYLASFGVLSPHGVIVGDVMGETLDRTTRAALARVSDVLTRQPGQQPKGVTA